MLISEAYAKENARLHKTDAKYGVEGYLWGYLIAGIARLERCRSILDYGCGKGTLRAALIKGDVPVGEYDPGVKNKDVTPDEPSDLVVCLDVMEHIEPEFLPNVMADLVRLTGKLLFVSISTKLSKRVMSDGRDTHLVLRPDEWWHQLFINSGFQLLRTWDTGRRQWVALLKAPSRNIYDDTSKNLSSKPFVSEC